MKIIACDLDGTLLKDDKTISEKTKNLINWLIESGYLFIPNTARSHKDLPKILLDTNVDYYICSNGASIYSKKLDKVVIEHKLDSKLVTEILDILKDTEKVTTIIANGIIYSENSLQDIWESENLPLNIQERIRSSRTMVNNVREPLKEYSSIEKLHFNYKDVNNNKLFRELLKDISEIGITSSDQGNLEITNKDSNKGLAILELASYLGLENNNFIAFGDNLNDVAMFDYAKVKIAMKNSNSDLMKLANEVTRFSNNEDGVANYIEEKILK